MGAQRLMRVILDTNVLLAALISAHGPARYDLQQVGCQ